MSYLRTIGKPRHSWRAPVCLLILGFGMAQLPAAPPPNDLRANATRLVFEQLETGTTIEATRESSDSILSTSFTSIVWYDWISDRSAYAEAALRHERPSGSYANAYVNVFREVSPGMLTQIAFGAGVPASLGWVELRGRFLATPGDRYFIAICSGNPYQTPFNLTLTEMTARNPNDDFAAPLDFTGLTVSTSLAAATLEPNEPLITGRTGSVWLRWTAPSAGWYAASCSGVHVMDVWKGSSLATLSSQIAGVKKKGTSPPVIQADRFVTFFTSPAEPVYLRILSYQDQSVTVTLTVSPPGDHFADAIDAGSATSFTFTNPIGGMSAEPGEPGGVGETYWVRWQAPHDGVFIARATTPPWESSLGGGMIETCLRPEVRVFQGSSPATAGANLSVPLGGLGGANQKSILRAVSGGLYTFQVGLTPSQPVVLHSSSSGSSSGGGTVVYGPTALSITFEEVSRLPNDDFLNAHDLASAANATATGTNVGATDEPGEPGTSVYLAKDSVWYRWTPPSTGFYAVTLDDTVGLRLTISRGTSLTSLVGEATLDTGVPNPEAPNPPEARMSKMFTQGVVYQFRITGQGAGFQDAFTLGLRQMAPPPNDMRSAATPLPSSHQLSITGTTVDATGESSIFGDAADANTLMSSVWWSWVAQESGWFAIARNGPAPLDLRVGVMENNVTMGSSLSNSPPLRFLATAGRVYHIRMATPYASEGIVNWTLDREPGFDHSTPGTALDIGNASALTTSPFSLPGGDPGISGVGGNGTSTSVGIWYRWTAPAGGWISVDTKGSQIPSSVGVWSAPSGGSLLTLPNMNSVSGLNPAPSVPPFSRVLAQVTAGQSCWINVSPTANGYPFNIPPGPVILRIRPALAPPALDSLSVTELLPAAATKARFVECVISITSPNGFERGFVSVSGAGSSPFEDRHRISGDAFSGLYRVAVPRASSAATLISSVSASVLDFMGGVATSTSAVIASSAVPWSSDTVAPVVENVFGLPPLIDLAGSPVTLNLQLAISDLGGSGFASGAVFFQENAEGSFSSSAPNRVWPSVQFDRSARTSGDMFSGVYAVSLIIPAGLPAREPGTLRIALRDTAGNELRTPQPIYPNYQASAPLVCEVRQTGLAGIQPPTISGAAAFLDPPAPGAPHGLLRVTATLSDSISGVNEGQIELFDELGTLERAWTFSASDRVSGNSSNGDY